MVQRRSIVKRMLLSVIALPFSSLFKLNANPMQEVPDQKFYELDKVYSDLKKSEKNYNPFLNVPKLNAGLYVLPTGSEDKQSPHTLDEVYYVISGKAKFKSGNEQTNVTAGSILYVKANVIHRFFEIEEELKIMVFFSEMK